MNVQVGKSAGIALLLAAALLAALFAMGVFAPAGVEAIKGTPKPTAMLDKTALSATDATLTVTFELNDDVNSTGRNVTVLVPVAVAVIPATGFTGAISVKQDGKDVGSASVTAAQTITIAEPTVSGRGIVDEDMLTTLTIGGLTLEGSPATGTVDVTQLAVTVSSNSIGIFNPAAVPTSASAEIHEDTPTTLVVKFTTQTATDAVTIDPPADYFLGGNVTISPTAGGETVDTTTTTGVITTGTLVASTAYTVTVTNLVNLDEDDEIELGQATSGYTTTLVVDGPTVSPTAATTDEGLTEDVLSPSTDDNGTTAKAGAKVRVTISAIAETTIGGGESIVITLPGFEIPSSIDRDDVIIDGRPDATDRPASYYGNPESVSISGDKITVRVPVRNNDSTRTLTEITGAGTPTGDTGSYKVIFFEEAGLTTPTSVGTKTIKVKDADDGEEELKVKIVPSVSVEPKSGFVTKGGDATVTAKGVRNGATTVYLVMTDDDGDPRMDDDGNYMRGAELGSGTAADGVAEIEINTSNLVVGADPMGDKDVGKNTLLVVDSANGDVDTVPLGIKPTVKLTSETAKRSAMLEISVSDWYYGNINKVTIGGISVGDVDETVGSDMSHKFKVTVPGNVRTGEQDVVVTGENPQDLNTASATVKVTIAVLPLDVSPSNVVPGHRVTITGSGFHPSTDVDSIMIGGKTVTVPDDADSTSSGRVAVTVTVPLDVGSGDKKVELTVGTRKGEGTITVPKPSIELDPAQSVPGSIISVTGSGFAADGRVEVRFAGDIEEVGVADGSGDIHIRLEIPSDAGVGETNEVMVAVRDPDDTDDVTVSISAKAEHKTPGPAITVPETAQVGTLATISGTNFEPFTSLTVMIGGKDATPSGAETDKNGAFEVEARVPRLSAGSHTITVEDGSTDENSVTETFTVVLTPVVSTPQEVFGVLGGKLTVVWRYDNATATWASYSPGAPAELNDLTGVSRGDIVWVQVTEDVMFQGRTLYLGTTGWNLITLE